MIGINAVANARSSELIIGLFSPTILHNEKIYGRSAPDISSFEPLGSFYSDSTVWATRDEVNVDFNDAEGRFFAVASNSDFNRILLPGFALDWNIHLVRGYAGSTDQVFALLRRDVDYIYSSSVSMANYIESTEGINVFISVSDGPNSIFPDVPYLAGTGGVVEQLTNDLPAEQQRERIILARLSSELGKTYRAVMISSNADSEQVVCLRNAVEGAMFSEEFRQRAIAQHLLVEPLSGSALGSVIAETDSLIEDNWRLLQKYMEKSQ
ncbi:MAG: hypothetical protein R3F41_18150 [Gammaproteobacteria bacterium]|nr:hypothetical protein [Pseudomonadales bacterium]